MPSCKLKTHFESNRTSQVCSFKIGKLHKIKSHPKKELEKAEITEYLIQLQELVAYLPKNKRLCKLEVISNVIDYIHDLRETLGLPACSATFDTKLAGTQAPSTSTITDSESKSVTYLPSSDSLITPTLPPQSKNDHRKPLCVNSKSARKRLQ